MSETNGYVLIVRTDDTYTIELVKGDILPVLQKAVGGYIERMPIPAAFVRRFSADCFANEEGLVKKLPYNRIATALYRCAGAPDTAFIAGDVVFARRHDLDTTGFDYDEAMSLSQFIQKGAEYV